MPKLWTDTIEGHRREVREAVLDATWALATARGPASVTMSEVAERAGIGRATLYKYFSDVDAILTAWHHRQIGRHLEQLTAIRERIDHPGRRLRAVLAAYAQIHRRRAQHQSSEQHGTELASSLHRDGTVADAQHQLHRFIRDVLDDAARAGDIRDDISFDELAGYCLHALTAAGTLNSDAAIDRLVDLTLAGIARG